MSKRVLAVLAMVTGSALVGAMISRAGPLDPPAGPVAPSYKTLTEVEPRLAINSTNAPGDTDSLYRISKSGSYYLTGNIVAPSGKSGIEIAADNVTIDLGGFTMTSVSSLDVIRLSLGGRKNISIRNGNIGPGGGGGIDIEPNISNSTPTIGGTVENVHVAGMATTGIRVGEGVTVRRCSVTGNGQMGISAEGECVITHCTAKGNGLTGISAGSASSVIGCVATKNDFGIGAGNYSLVTDCVASENVTGGIGVSIGASVIDCTATLNGTDGIGVLRRCLVRGNSCSENGTSTTLGAGIRVRDTGYDNRIEDNSCTGNSRGFRIEYPGNFIVRNTCAGNSVVNWDVASNNTCYVVDAINGTAIFGDDGGVAPGSSNPSTNYTY